MTSVSCTFVKEREPTPFPQGMGKEHHSRNQGKGCSQKKQRRFNLGAPCAASEPDRPPGRLDAGRWATEPGVSSFSSPDAKEHTSQRAQRFLCDG